ncbi:MAG: VCBS repeat-containing protein [Paracoccaceae bacterium]
MRILYITMFLAATAWVAQAHAQLTFAERGGSFAAMVSYPVGIAPYSVAVADFNGDGKADLATGNPDSDNISVLLGNGNGTFAAATSFAAGDGSEGLVVADFNADGKADIAVANLWASTVSISLGNGTGGFAAPVHYSVGLNPHTVVAADFNGDGKLDLASADGSQNTVSMLLGTGTGAFLPSVQIATGCMNPRDLVAADFDGNGKVDVAVTCQGSANIAVLLGNGAGGFGTPALIAVGTEPFGISAGKFDAGNTQDLAVAVLGSDKVAILLGDGNGGFAPTAGLTSIYRPRTARVLDLDGDGKQDLAVIQDWNQIFIYMGSGTGGFSASTAFTAGGGTNGSAVGDFNGDGKLDLAVTSAQDNAIAILINTSLPPLNIAPSATVEAGSSYTFRKAPIWINRQTSGTYPAGFPFSHTGYADLDRDGDTDFVRTFSDNEHPFPLQVMINDGNGSFNDQTATRIVGAQPGLTTTRKVLIGDYNGDRWPDVMVLGHGIDTPPFPGEYPQLFLSNGNGTLSYAPGLESYVDYHHGGASADVDGNGTIDVFTNARQPYFLLNDGQGHFTPNTARVPRAPGNLHFGPIASELVDVDRDGFIDLVADGYEPNGLSNAIYWGNSSGVYLYANRSVLAAVPDMGVTLDFAIEDIDNDGLRDIVAVRTGSTNLYVGRYIQILRQTSARVFVDQTATRISFNPALLPFDYIRAQDINGDGFVDLFIDDKNDVASGQYAWINNGAGVFAPYTGVVTPSMPWIFRNGFEGM